MSSVEVESAEQVQREVLELSRSDPIPSIHLVSAPDPHRSLKVVVPLDPTQATWVEYEQTPLFLNATRTKFVVKPPFEASRPPRFVFYMPHENGKPIDRHLVVSVVEKDKPLEGDKNSVYSVFPVAASRSSEPIARGLMIRRSDCSFTILDVDRNQEITILSKQVRLEREAVFRPGVGAAASLLGHSESSVPVPLGVRYGLTSCLNAKFTYLFDLRRQKDSSELIPTYEVIIQHQFLIQNESAIKFSRISSISIASDTFRASDDGYPARSLLSPITEGQTMQLVRPFYTLHEAKATLPAHGSMFLTDRVAAIDQCYAVVTVNATPVQVGEYAKMAMNVWMPTQELYKAASQPGVAQLYIKNGIPGFDDIVGVTRWQRGEDQTNAAVPWSRLVFPEAVPRMSAQCIVRQAQLEVDFVSISMINYFSRPMVVAFAVYPGVPGACSQIEAVSGARLLSDYPWMNSTRGVDYRVFVVESYKEPISFRGTIIASK